MLFDFARYYSFAELTAALEHLATSYPQLAKLTSIGTSYAGRSLWLMTVTDFASGPAEDKPAYWLDANIHASEVAGSMAALHLLLRLLEGQPSDPAIARLLAERAFYIVPRANPDGAEQILSGGKFLRSGTRPYPYEEPQNGLYPEDIDGDGRILQMRVRDQQGNWKASDKDPRLLVRRAPDEEGGIYYRVYSEGRIRNYDGWTIPLAPAEQGLDFNRSFPVDWQPEGQQPGAGPYPLSEPETRALAAFVTAHPNIYAGISYHTYSGAVLRPYSDKSDEAMPLADLRTYEAIGKRATEITGYPAISAFHGFRYDPRGTIHGVFDDWLYDHLGIYAFTVELWDPFREAGIEGRDFIGWFRDHPEADDLKLLAWNDSQLGGRGFVPWYPCEHPQLGPVELGGWDGLYVFSNPPPKRLLAEIAPNTEFVLAHARMGPRLALHHFAAEPAGPGLLRLEAVIVNTGFLPTCGSQKALDRQAARPIRVSLQLPPGATLLAGEAEQTIGHLEGRAHQTIGWGVSPKPYPTDHLKRLSWVVRLSEPGAIHLVVAGGRAGTVRGGLGG